MIDDVDKLFTQYPAVPIGVLLALFLYAILGGKKRKASGRQASMAHGLLTQVILWWSRHDPFRVADLLRSIAIFGASGSGKTSGSGFQIAKAIVGMGRKASLLILASKPEERQFWSRIYAKAGRIKDLLIFGPNSPLRFNFIDFLQKMGADTREITNALMIISETLRQNSSSGNKEAEAFWRQQKERLIYNAVEIVGRAKGRVTAPDLQRFINSAALTPADIGTPRFEKSFHQECMREAFGKLGTSIQKHDYQLAFDLWMNEYPCMDAKPRSSILADVMGVLHIFNTGIVRELMSTTTNVSPAVFNEGLSVLVDMPISSDGAAAAFVLGAWKFATEWFILKRQATEKTPICVTWCDEAQKVLNEFDVAYLAECRSHRGCMILLTQSIHSYYARLGGKNGEHEADALLTNAYHKIFHMVGDDKTAQFASSLIGRRLRTHMGGSMAPAESMADDLFGKSRMSSSFNQSMENILENRAFLQGMRTGGRENGYWVDGVVIRGETFSTGENYLKVAFNQKA